jgi:dynein intermediate chain 2
MSCLRFNPKSSETLVGGCLNGLITCFDLRKPNASTGRCRSLENSIIEKSHHDPVTDIQWVSSKTGHQCVSVSTDGKLLWWDTRKLGEPIDSLVLTSDSKSDMLYGGSSLEYSTEAGPTKYLIGSEQGVVVSVNLRNRKVNDGIVVYDSGSGKHHGAIYAIRRNPIHNKYFLTIGDWTARVWTEDLKTPILTTKYHDSYLTGGCWSPSRPSVVFVTRADGVLDVWDFYHGQNNVAYSHKVGNAVLSSIGIQENGKLVAVGDVNGAVHLLEVCESLASPRPNEKSTINAVFERETKREKNLEIREKEMKRAKLVEEDRVKQEATEKESESSEKVNHILRQIEQDFQRLAEEKTDYEDDKLFEIMTKAQV